VGCEQHQRERDRGGKKVPPVLKKELRHVPSVPEKVSRVRDCFVPKLRRNWHEIDTGS
jgi:hypothetical protein